MNSYDHKLNLTDVSFLIPVRIDSPERYENLLLVIKYFSSFTDTHLLILEADESPKISANMLKKNVEYFFVSDIKTKFHRTRYINQLVMTAQTPYICIYDADVIIPLKQLEEAIDLLKDGFSYVLPYDGSMVSTNEEEKQQFIVSCEPAVFNSKICSTHVCGGAIFMNRDAFMQMGMSNENITSWGPDDVEQRKRVEILGKRMARTEGVLYHLPHPRGQNSCYEDYKERLKLTGEYVKIAAMRPDELRKYTASWKWSNQENGEQTNLPEHCNHYYQLLQGLDLYAIDYENDSLYEKIGLALGYFRLSRFLHKEVATNQGLALLDSACEKIKSDIPDDKKILIAWAMDFMQIHFHIPERFNEIGQQVDSWLFNKLMSHHIPRLSMPDGALAIAYYYHHLLINKRQSFRYEPVYYQEQLIFVTDEIYDLLLRHYHLRPNESYTASQLQDMGIALLLADRLTEVGVNAYKVEKINIWLWETMIHYFKEHERFDTMDVWPLFAMSRICERSRNWHLSPQIKEWCKTYVSQNEVGNGDECTQVIQYHLWEKAGYKILSRPIPKNIYGILCELDILCPSKEETIFL